MRKQFTHLQKHTYVRQFHKSNMTQTAFCKLHGLAVNTFNRWVHESKFKLRSTPIVSTVPFTPALSPPLSSAFVPIQLQPQMDETLSKLPSNKPSELGTDFPSAVTSAMPIDTSPRPTLCLKFTAVELHLFLDLSQRHGQQALKTVIQTLMPA